MKWKLLALVSGAIGVPLIALLASIAEGTILAFQGVRLTGLVNGGPILIYSELFTVIFGIAYYVGIAFLFGFHFKEISWKWGWWMSLGLLLLTLVCWPIIDAASVQWGIEISSFALFAFGVLLGTVPIFILSSFGGYLGAKYRNHT
jgi:hypothetical protein